MKPWAGFWNGVVKLLTLYGHYTTWQWQNFNFVNMLFYCFISLFLFCIDGIVDIVLLTLSSSQCKFKSNKIEVFSFNWIFFTSSLYDIRKILINVNRTWFYQISATHWRTCRMEILTFKTAVRRNVMNIDSNVLIQFFLVYFPKLAKF